MSNYTENREMGILEFYTDNGHYGNEYYAERGINSIPYEYKEVTVVDDYVTKTFEELEIETFEGSKESSIMDKSMEFEIILRKILGDDY